MNCSRVTIRVDLRAWDTRDSGPNPAMEQDNIVIITPTEATSVHGQGDQWASAEIYVWPWRSIYGHGDHVWLGRLVRGRGDQWGSAEINARPLIPMYGRRYQCATREINPRLHRSMGIHGDQCIASEIMHSQGYRCVARDTDARPGRSMGVRGD